ncbi:hypothetical protein NO932_06000 [Pelagibacterium sp. 26DY04]|uniref:hypothetical protein n=1 Tax=Pelagibacterium sp. 26DY04 TaxID=2967130 RepID=UPI0028152782|nr:hypothetical protein [Pelagibacterium sp. 26DY04]WMT88160.1 hypothetical protein NO932_06000 [Pelagibacterium sp. 26DY04]
MNKIVLEHYPVDKLPEDLQRAVRPATSVSLTLVPEETVKSLADIKKSADAIRARPGFKPVAPQEAVDRIRDLRNEWD